MKKEKCEFARIEVIFLGHWVSKGQVRMDEQKVQAIVDWSVPTKVSELRSFLGLANYYRKFIKKGVFEEGCTFYGFSKEV